MTQREASRKDWSTGFAPPSLEQINSGSLQRIADATEKMFASYDRLREQKDWAIERGDRYLKALQTADRRIAALRGVITKMRRGK